MIRQVLLIADQNKLALEALAAETIDGLRTRMACANDDNGKGGRLEHAVGFAQIR